ncbi:DinB family protein [Halomonas vilamensis]|uniref:DinB family protein n=1 Tax=Vreelandella vilamensis TaxID=531309 RepID=A0ABU1H737_9GAMM|nr:DinB family protein [Halomonas vilamensis]MDR5899920.1 DinB family protein [Halomonas vilamensis]
MPSSITAQLIGENQHALNQLEALLPRVEPEAYQRLLGAQSTQSLGRHVRHVLEHYQTLLDACTALATPTTLDYERRQREAALENDPAQALARVKMLQDTLATLTVMPHDTPLTLRYPIKANELDIPTSLGRELAFLTSHSVHHMALIGLLCEILGITLPKEFGVHPSTLRYWEQQAG